jgi:hypothetical protein
MSITYHHDDQEFTNAICEYQDNNTKPLEIWLSKNDIINDDKKIEEIVGQIFMIYDAYFVSGTSALLAKAVEKIKAVPNKNYNANSLLNASLWLEKPEDFKKLFLAYEKAFCLNEKSKTVSEHFHKMKRLDKEGFWDAIMWFDFEAKFNEEDNINMINMRPNIELWLTRVKNVKDLVQPYCLPIKDEVKFEHLAYAVFHYGYEIERHLLGRKVESYRDISMIFAESAKDLEYNQLSSELNTNSKSNKKHKL